MKALFLKDGDGGSSAPSTPPRMSAHSNMREAPLEVWAEIDAELDKEFEEYEDDLVRCIKELTGVEAQTGDLGEEIAAKYLQSRGHDMRTMNKKGNNAAVDIVHGHAVTEVKAGLISNSKSAQQWNIKLGEPAKTEKAWLKKASPEARRKHNLRKAEAAINRKLTAVANASKRTGRDLKQQTLTMIINPDIKVADLFLFDGFHARVGWNSEEAKKAYVGTFKYA